MHWKKKKQTILWRNYILPEKEVTLHAMNSRLSVSHLTDFDRIIIYDVLIGQSNINILSRKRLPQA